MEESVPKCDLSLDLQREIFQDHLGFVSDMGSQIATIGLGLKVVLSLIESNQISDATQGLTLMDSLVQEITDQMVSRQVAVSGVLGFLNLDEIKEDMQGMDLPEVLKDTIKQILDQITKSED
jgi:hypothetical protein